MARHGLARTSSRTPAPASNTWLWVLGGTALVASLGGVAFALMRGGSAPVATQAERGYRFLPGCAGVEVTDETKAMAYASGMGQKSGTLSDLSNLQAWLLEANAALSYGDDNCPLDKVPKPAVGFIYRLGREYIRAAAQAGHVPADFATKFIASLRDAALVQGVPPSELPE